MTRAVLLAGVLFASSALAALGAGSLGWAPPTRLSSGDIAVDPDVAVGPAGDALVVWDRQVGSVCPSQPANPDCVHVVEAASRPPGSSTWSPAVELVRPGIDSRPQAALDPTGSAIVVVVHDIGEERVLEASFRRGRSGEWPEPLDLSEITHRIGPHPAAFDAAGNATVVWAGTDAGGRTVVVAKQRDAASGTWGGPIVLSRRDGDAPGGPSLAVNATGDAVVAWTLAGPNGRVVQASFRSGPSGPWSAPIDLSAPDAELDPAVAIDAVGDAVAVWSRGAVEGAFRPAGGSWTGSVPLSSALPGPREPDVALDTAGNAVAVWRVGVDIESAARPRTTGVWSTPVPVSGPVAEPPRVALDASGNAVALWSGPEGETLSALRPAATGRWLPAARVSSAGAVTRAARLAAGPGGSTVAAWLRTVSPRTVVEAADLMGTGPLLTTVRIPPKASTGVFLPFAVVPVPWSAPLAGQTFWRFGDGTSAAGIHVAHAYVVPGDYTVSVTQTDAAGGVATTSGRVEIRYAPLRNTTLPSIVGTPRVGATLACAPGSWTGDSPIHLAFHWLRNGRSIPGASARRYRARPRDGGALVTCRVAARNAAGERAAKSKPLRIGGAAVRALASRSAATSNPIQRENALAGNAGWGDGSWEDSAISGYGSESSVGPGETLHLHVSSAADYRVEIFRLGWYSGAGARLVSCLPGCGAFRSGQAYGAPPPAPGTGELRLSWPVTDTVLVPVDWVSGYYLARLVPSNGDAPGTVPFVVRETGDRPSPILVEVPVNTWQAYNAWGGKSLYDFNSTDGVPANRVSFDRPYLWSAPGSQAVSGWELPVVRFLEREGYDVSYATDVDVDRDPSLLLRHRLVLVNGHGEYWTKSIRDAFDAALASATNVAFLGANIGYWQVRFENDGRTMVGYKTAPDPEPDPSLDTRLFRELMPPRPECALLGVQHYTGSYDWPRADFQVGAADDPWFAGTGLTGTSVVVGVVSREHDQIPAGSPVGASCGLNVTVLLHHEGVNDLVRAEAVRYTAPSGARVFSSGSLELGWALDAFRSRGEGTETPVDPRVQAFVRNMLGDLQIPAAPSRVTARRLARSTRVTVSSGDPRIDSFLVYRHRGSAPFAPGQAGVARICASRSSICLDRARPVAGLYRYAAVAVDPWGRSPAQLSAAVRVPKPKSTPANARPPKGRAS